MILAAALLAAPLVFHTDAGEFANVVYNVACLTHQISCTTEKYERFWKEELDWSPADQRELVRWQTIVADGERRAPAATSAPLLPNYLSYYPGLRFRQSIIATALDTDSAGEFRRRAGRVVSAADARALASALSHFQQRLHPWWERVGRARVRPVRDVERALTPARKELARRAAAFVHAPPDLTDVFMHVVPSPDVSNDEATGTAVRNHFFMELVPPDTVKEPAADVGKMVVSIGLHELTHAFYDSAPVQVHQEIMQQFVDSSDARAPSFYTYLNEAIATAVQEMADDEPRSEGGGYRDAYIPRLGHAAVPLIADAMFNGKTMSDGFVAGYLRNGREVLNGDVDTLQFALSSAAVIASDPMQSAVQEFRKAFSPRFTVSTQAEWQTFGELNAVLLLDYREAGQFTSHVPLLDTLTTHRGFAFLTGYKKKSRMLMLAGRDPTAVADVVARLATMKSVPPNGVIFTID
jgi:hypothetical protein